MQKVKDHAVAFFVGLAVGFDINVGSRRHEAVNVVMERIDLVGSLQIVAKFLDGITILIFGGNHLKWNRDLARVRRIDHSWMTDHTRLEWRSSSRSKGNDLMLVLLPFSLSLYLATPAHAHPSPPRNAACLASRADLLNELRQETGVLRGIGRPREKIAKSFFLFLGIWWEAIQRHRLAKKHVGHIHPVRLLTIRISQHISSLQHLGREAEDVENVQNR